METRVVIVNADNPEPEQIAEAAAVIRSGGLVAFPTETVYGLGANALDASAVEKIFMAKGRPAANPLIVHTNSVESAKTLVSNWPEAADKMAQSFWPGPLTLVLPKAEHVPDIVTAGGPTVGVRVPSHPVALALIAAAGVPIAAPSANRSESVSPTLAGHVLTGLNGRIAMVLDGGPVMSENRRRAPFGRGIESTVVDVSVSPPRLLRPGLIAPNLLEDVVGPITRTAQKEETENVARSPGQQKRHYAPLARVEFVSERTMWQRARDLADSGKKAALIYTTESGDWKHHHVPNLSLHWMQNAREYAEALYQLLHDLDRVGTDVILVQNLPRGDEWLAIRDRLTRAAAPKAQSSDVS